MFKESKESRIDRRCWDDIDVNIKHEAAASRQIISKALSYLSLQDFFANIWVEMKGKIWSS